MNVNRSTLRAIRAPVTLITLGLLFALNNFTRFGFSETWPVLLIVFGALSLLCREGSATPPPPRSDTPRRLALETPPSSLPESNDEEPFVRSAVAAGDHWRSVSLAQSPSGDAGI